MQVYSDPSECFPNIGKSVTLRGMKHQILTLLSALFFTLTLCACATETRDAVIATPDMSPKEPASPVSIAPSPQADNKKAVIAPVETAISAPVIVKKPVSLPVEEVSSAQQILDFARAQLPKEPIRMNGSLKERAPNGFVKKALTIEMDLNWGGAPANATYRIRDEKSGVLQTLEIEWFEEGPEFRYSEAPAASGGTNQAVTNFNPNTEIDGLGVTWADLSFAFLWTRDAKTEKSDKKLGKDCYVISVPRGDNHLLIWIEKETGRVFGAKEEAAGGKTVKEIKVVSVKEFGDIWMVKDVDIIRPLENGRTSLRIENVEAVD